MQEPVYRIKVKDGDSEIDISGDKKFVIKSFDDIKVLLNKNLRSVQPITEKKQIKKSKKTGRKKKPGPKPKTSKKNETKLTTERIDLKNITLENLLKVKKPRKENQRVLLLAYYMNKVKRKREFRGKDLEALYVDLKLEVPKNLNYHLRRMAEKERGLIAQGKRNGRYKITDKGVDVIHEEISSA